jgi:uncharacterized repeat protein (TIGR01451 family)/fimbrial isopeptide formation D2 family protein
MIRSHDSGRVRRMRWTKRMMAALAILAGTAAVAAPALPAAAAGTGTLVIGITITDQNGAPISVVDASTLPGGVYRVLVSIACNNGPCDNSQVKLAGTPADPYYGTNYKEQAGAFTPPSGLTPTPAATGSPWDGYTVALGNVPIGYNGSMYFDFNVGARRAGAIAGNFFPNGSPIAPTATATSSSASVQYTTPATATWKSSIPTPTLSLAPSQSSINTDTALTITATLNSGCFSGSSIPWYLCGNTSSTVVDLPSNAQYVANSGGTYDPATRTVTLTGDPKSWVSTKKTFQVTFPSNQMPTTSPGCVLQQTFTAHDATYTFLDGTVQPTNPATATAQVTVGNCAPFAKGSLSKFATQRGSPTVQTQFDIPTTGSYDLSWTVVATNESNVPAVATIVDDTLDQPDLAVYQVQTGSAQPTTSMSCTQEDGQVVAQSNVATITAGAGHRFVSCTVVSPTLAAPNVQSTDTGSTPFSVRYFAPVKTGATPNVPHTNRASVTLTFPSNPELGTYTPPTSPAQSTVTLVNPATPFTLSAGALTAATSDGSTPIVGSDTTWSGSGSASNLTAGTNWTPQYVFLAPRGWTINSNGASLSPAVSGATFSYRTVTYSGQSYQAVVVTWPGPITATGSVTLPTLSVKTQPTGSASAGTNNQTGYLFLGDANNLTANAYGNVSGGYADSTDLDGDGVTTDRFDRNSGATSLGANPSLLPVKYICRPDVSASDGCDWIADPSITVGVPPQATSIKYKIVIANIGNAPVSNVTAYDVLPYIGDLGTSNSTAGKPRGSTVQEQISSVTNGNADVTLAYSTSTNPPRNEVYSGPTTGDWSAPAAGAAAIRVTIPTLAAGDSRSFLYTAALVGAAADQIACNSIAVTATGLGVSEPAPVCATTQQADLSISAPSRLPLQSGRVGTVPFLVNNGGGSQSASATVSISIPADVVVVSLTPAGWTCSAPSTTGPVTLTCTPVNGDGSVRSLQKNVPDTIALSVKPNSSAAAQLCFDGTVTGSMNDPDLSNNTTSACSTNVPDQPELVVNKDDGKTAVAVGEQYSYTITAFSRLVAETIGGVTVTDTLPAGLQFQSAVPAPSSQSGQTITWNVGTLQQAGIASGDGDLTTGGAGSSFTATITVTVAPGTQDSVRNLAQAAGTDPADGSALSAQSFDTDAVTNVFTDLHADETTPQNTARTTPLSAIVTAAGAPLDPTSVTQKTQPSHGSLSIDPSSGAVTYTPETGYSGDDVYTVTVCDTSSTPECTTGTVTVHVGANTVDAVDDPAATTAATPVTTDVRANDTTATGQPLALPTVVAQPAHGSARVAPDGAIVYTPSAGFSGVDSYGYQVCDTSHPTPVCDTATVTVTVTNVFTDGPAADGHTGTETAQNAPVTTPLSDIVTVTGAPVDPASIVESNAPAHGTIAIDAATGAVTYTPETGYTGPDSYGLHLCDTTAPTPQCHDVTVSVTVLANAVAAPDLTVTTKVDQPAAPLDVLSRTSSSSAQPLEPAPTIVTDPVHGTVTVNADGTITYTPDDGFDGADSYVYQVCDTSHPTPVCDSGTVQVTVTPVADLTVTKTASRTDVLLGDTVTFTIVVKNHGPSPAKEVTVTDTPAGLQLTGSTPSQGAFDGHVWAAGTVASGDTVTLTVTEKVSALTASNTASVRSAAEDPSLADNTSTASLHVSPRPAGGAPQHGGGGLAGTGSDVGGPWWLLGAALLAAGAVLVRRRRATRS